MTTLKNMTSTSPAVQVCLETDSGQSLVFKMHFDPYQNPKEQDASITKKILAIPKPEKSANLKLCCEAFSKHFQYSTHQNDSPFSCLTVLMAEMACSARPPASAYDFCSFLSFSSMTLMQKQPAIPRAGMVARTTKVMSHPVTKAKAKPAIRVAIVMIIVDIFSPIAPWKANVSVANFDASYVWLITSNHPISCLSRLRRQAFRHEMACLSPVIIQQANISQPAKKAPIPTQMNMNIVSFDFSTMASGDVKLSVIFPQIKAKAGNAAPIAMAAIDPTIIRIWSNLVANRKSWQNHTYLGSSGSQLEFTVLALETGFPIASS